MPLKSINFMSNDFNSNNIEKDEFNHNSDESDYKDLMNRLKEIKTTIVLLEKIIFK
tara:strand:+ start:151 stop:318 length:168 start_codon:yes stop_codon:yes gene_type:complete